MPELLPQLRDEIREATYAQEPTVVQALLDASSLDSPAREAVRANAISLVERCRGKSHKAGTLDAFLQEFGLSNNGGVALDGDVRVSDSAGARAA